MRLTNLREGHEELNLPADRSIDTEVYRSAYRDLIKNKSTSNITYNKFLHRMKERNIASRIREFERRKLQATWSKKDVEFVSA